MSEVSTTQLADTPGTTPTRVTIKLADDDGGLFFAQRMPELLEDLFEGIPGVEFVVVPPTPAPASIDGRSALAFAISACRDAFGLTQREFAEICGISRSHLGSIERDEFRPDSWLTGHIARTVGAYAGRRHAAASIA
jgi:DNA-binding XRE family transcriptional regulator